MKKSLLLILSVGMLALTGCSADDGVSPMTPTAETPETEFPVNKEFPGLETEIAAHHDPQDDLVDTAIHAGFNTLVEAVQRAGLEQALRGDGPFTVFAPTNEAFAKLPAELLEQLLRDENQAKLQQLLLYHVVPGRVTSPDLRFFQRVETLEGSDLRIVRFFRLILVNSTWVRLANVMATNGVIHVIDEVLIPESFSLDDPVEPMRDLVDTAAQAGLTTLVTAVQTAGLESALRGDGPLSVFAPTNAAFDALPPAVVSELFMPENVELLQKLLLYHVTSGDVRSTDLRHFQFVTMLQGDKTLVWKKRDVVRVNFSRVVTPDVLATNGVAHVINRVLIPPSFYGRLRSLPDEAPNLLPDQELAGAGVIR